MGTFYTNCRIQHHAHRKKTAEVRKLPVDTGSGNTWISATTLERLGVKPEKKDVPFVMANGRTITRDVGFVILHVGEVFTIDEVVFGHKGDLQLLGARTLEGMGLTVNPREKKLVASGPHPAAAVD